jgi:LPS-assembly lipoprotein
MTTSFPTPDQTFAARGRRYGVLLAVACMLTLSACGFKLRGSDGSYNLPFNKLYIGLPNSSPLAIDLKRNIRPIGTTEIVDKMTDADGVLEVLSNPDNTRSKSILALNTNGRVSQYLLTYSINFRVHDQQGNTLMPPTTITLTRSLDFDDQQLLAKQSEEDLLYRDMQKDLVQQMLRRMATIKPVINTSPVNPAVVPAAATPVVTPGATPGLTQ